MLGRTLYDFLNHHWFRVEVEGIDNAPEDGGPPLVCNHGGALRPDGIMIAKALHESTRIRGSAVLRHS